MKQAILYYFIVSFLLLSGCEWTPESKIERFELESSSLGVNHSTILVRKDTLLDEVQNIHLVSETIKGDSLVEFFSPLGHQEQVTSHGVMQIILCSEGDETDSIVTPLFLLVEDSCWNTYPIALPPCFFGNFWNYRNCIRKLSENEWLLTQQNENNPSSKNSYYFDNSYLINRIRYDRPKGFIEFVRCRATPH